MAKQDRVPLGVSAEKKGDIYEIRLYYEPDALLDGVEYLKYDKVFKIVFKTRFRIIANWYVNNIARKYKLHYQIQQINNTRDYNGAFKK